MRTLIEIEEDIKVLIQQIDGEDAIEEVKVEYVPFEANKTLLMESENIEEYLENFDKICTEDSAVLDCFSISNKEDLEKFIDENSVDLEALKIETMVATCEALKYLIYEAEDEEY